MKYTVPISLLLILVNCSKQKQKTNEKQVDTVSMAAPVGLPGSVSQPQQTDGVPGQAGRWRYEKTADRMGNPVYKASLRASNVLQFAYPYAGGSTATLTVRRANNDTYAYLEVSNGQFNRSFQPGIARVRIDGQPPVTYALSAAANGRANIVFFDAAPTLIVRIKRARRVSMLVEFAAQKTQKIEFATAGLRWNH